MPKKRPEPDVVIDGDELVMGNGKEIQLASPSVVSPISEHQLRRLWEKTPEHAVRYREGGGGKVYSYIPHGYAEFKLNEAFGGDWDFEMMPYFDGGNCFYLHTAEVREKRNPTKIVAINQSVTVVGRLTVRVRNPENPSEILTTIVKTEPGSSAYFPENEFGDSVKSAASDSFKRCAFRLGIAADRYYDDEKAKESFELNEKIRKAQEESLREAMANTAPTDPIQVITRVKKDYDITAADLFTRLYNLPFAQGVEQLKMDLANGTAEEVWKHIKSTLFPNSVAEDGSSEG